MASTLILLWEGSPQDFRIYLMGIIDHSSKSGFPWATLMPELPYTQSLLLFHLGFFLGLRSGLPTSLSLSSVFMDLALFCQSCHVGSGKGRHLNCSLSVGKINLLEIFFFMISAWTTWSLWVCSDPPQLCIVVILMLLSIQYIWDFDNSVQIIT